ncbi:OmpA family protein [Paraliomyxa miuraensis]|uniref:OmpA family protein n=1 Tax=Paraliomyxa miuraensis TaxID=376150 RepID=UPI00225813E2|nr:OmpA family protein [Paraliomyxa miuraensis]MCX4246803.1 OmpA family protein [Paraliomyxa miuraensis]
MGPEPEAGADAEASGSASVSLGGGKKEKKAKGQKSASRDKKDKGKKNKGEATAEGEAKGNVGTETAEEIKAKPWIRRWAPTKHMVEVGIMGGVYLPGKNHELFEPTFDLPDQGFRNYKTIGPEIGARISYMPLRFFGVELEGAAMPTQTDNDVDATIFGFRGQLIAQLPRWSITPFVLVGGGLLGVQSERNAVGADIDPSAHFGGGVKIFFNRQFALRLDARDVMSHKRGVDETFKNHNFEGLVSFVLTFNRPKPYVPPPIPDTDGDGILDPDDQCVNEPGVPEYQGCPIPDTDGDGILDPDDQCVNEPGVPEYDGCPIPDTDGDGILDPDDKCLDVPGVPEYDGCPIPDTDGDGILDPDDQCVNEPETPNGYEDGDGCPDEVPEEVKKFTGVIEGIRFDTNKSTIKKTSFKTLDAAVEVLIKFPSVGVEISGHTDDVGKREDNMTLSQDRANSVKDYMVGKGVDASRITTRGAGPDEPVDTNKTKKGRAKNRRIEFKIKQ